MLVAAGIFASRIVGLVRQRAVSHYLGLTTDAADAWSAGFRIPNLLQNLFGEGALSASFIPAYAGLLAQGRRRDADRLAGAVAAWLALVVTVVVAAGVVATPALIQLLAPGFTGEKRALLTTVVRILFPGAGLLVCSAWCLGVLNSHHRFLLSYAAPVVWSLSMIAALVWFGPATDLPRLVEILAWASVAGSVLQCLVQLPFVLRLMSHFSPRFDVASPELRAVARNFVPTFVSRGVVQISASVDTVIASWLPTGVTAGLTNAQALYTLPISLFGMSIAAAELPAMASDAATATEARGEALRRRLDAALRRVTFFVAPSAVAFLMLGDVVAAAVLQSGRFAADDATFVWSMLAGSAIGLLASTHGRLYASAFFALQDTHTPLRCAVARVSVAMSLGAIGALLVPRWLGIDPAWGGAGLTAGSGLAAWAELWLLRRALAARIGGSALSLGETMPVWLVAIGGAAAARAVRSMLPPWYPLLAAGLVLATYGLIFLLGTLALGVNEASTAIRRLVRFRS